MSHPRRTPRRRCRRAASLRVGYRNSIACTSATTSRAGSAPGARSSSALGGSVGHRPRRWRTRRSGVPSGSAESTHALDVSTASGAMKTPVHRGPLPPRPHTATDRAQHVVVDVGRSRAGGSAAAVERGGGSSSSSAAYGASSFASSFSENCASVASRASGGFLFVVAPSYVAPLLSSSATVFADLSPDQKPFSR